MTAKGPENTQTGRGKNWKAPSPETRVRSLWPHFLVPVLVALILLCFYSCGS